MGNPQSDDLPEPFVPLTTGARVTARPSLGHPLKVRIVAWGTDLTLAGLALRRAEHYARTFGFTVLDHLASHGPTMSAAPLVDVATRRFTRREIDYGHAWWLIPHAAVSPTAFTRAKQALRTQWTTEATLARNTPSTSPAALIPKLPPTP